METRECGRITIGRIQKDGLGDIKEDINKKSLNWVDIPSEELWNDKTHWRGGLVNTPRPT